MQPDLQKRKITSSSCQPFHSTQCQDAKFQVEVCLVHNHLEQVTNCKEFTKSIIVLFCTSKHHLQERSIWIYILSHSCLLSQAFSISPLLHFVHHKESLQLSTQHLYFCTRLFVQNVELVCNKMIVCVGSIIFFNVIAKVRFFPVAQMFFFSIHNQVQSHFNLKQCSMSTRESQ